jgi:hypothetical protein
MSVLLSSTTTPDFGRSCVQWIEPFTMTRAAPEESRGGPVNYSDADHGDSVPCRVDVLPFLSLSSLWASLNALPCSGRTVLVEDAARKCCASVHSGV